MAWFTREKPGVEGTAEADKRVRTEGLWLKCDGCGQIIWKKTLDENLQVCQKCEHHFRLDARARMAMLFDEGSYEQNGQIRIDFGTDTPFLQDDVDLDAEAAEYVKQNVQLLVDFTNGVQQHCGISSRLLWSESGESLAQKLIARLQQVN